MVESEEVAYLLLIDGIPLAMATSETVDKTYVQTLGFEGVYHGLAFPQALDCGLDLRKGMLDGSTATFVIEDVDGSLPALFGASLESAEPLLVRVDAGTDPADSSLWGKYVGTETMGSAGERRRYSCVPGWHVGMGHISAGHAEVTGVAASAVRDVPIVWEGRRCCVYRLTRPVGSSQWPDLTDESVRVATRVWFGTLLGRGEQEGRVWRLDAAGPESWIMGSLGASITQIPYPIDVGVHFDTDAHEHVLVGWLDIMWLTDETTVKHTYALQTTNTDLLAGADSYADVVAAVDSFLQILANDNSQGTALSAEGLSGLRCSALGGQEGIAVRWDRAAHAGGDLIADGWCLRLQLLAHPKVWKILGYDPEVQRHLDPLDEARFAEFRPSHFDVDYPDHWRLIAWSASPQGMQMRQEHPGAHWQSFDDWPHTTNNKQWRQWWPIYRGGANVFDLNATLQPFWLTHFEPVFLVAASKAAPLPADPDDPSSPATIAGVGPVTHQGLVAFTGPYRDETDPEAEVKTITMIARVAWREHPDGSIATENARPKLLVYEWPEPKLYGLELEVPKPTLWAAWRLAPEDGQPHVMRPLLVTEHGTGPDVASYVMARLWASTGAGGGWFTDDSYTTPAYGLSGTARQEPGPNDLGIPGIGDLGRVTDANESTFALAVPAEMIAAGADEQGGLEAAIEQMADPDLFRVKVCVGKVVSALDVMRSILSPIGWSVCLAGGKFGLFDPFHFQAPLTDSGVVTSESFAGTPGEPDSVRPSQDLRKYGSIDRVILDARLNPITGEHARSEVLRSPDPGMLYRAQSIEHRVDGSHLIYPKLENTKGAYWLGGWQERWRVIGRWWNERHFECTLTLPASRHAEFWPGSVISVSSEWLVDPAGAAYGIVQAPGYVTSRRFDAVSCTIEVTCLVSAKTLRLYAPAAKATRYVTDEGGVGYQLICEDDYLGIRGNTGTFDVQGFVEPSWSQVGGDADIEIFAFDGVEWTGGIYGTVASVHAEPGNCYIQLTGPLTGATWLRDQHHIVVLRDALEQTAAWPYVVYAPIGDKSGEFAALMKSPKFTE